MVLLRFLSGLISGGSLNARLDFRKHRGSFFPSWLVGAVDECGSRIVFPLGGTPGRGILAVPLSHHRPRMFQELGCTHPLHGEAEEEKWGAWDPLAAYLVPSRCRSLTFWMFELIKRAACDCSQHKKAPEKAPLFTSPSCCFVSRPLVGCSAGWDSRVPCSFTSIICSFRPHGRVL